MRTVLMNPGPVLCDERVRAALLGPDACHREGSFKELLSDTRHGLTRVTGGTAHDTVILTGSGTSAVESMLASVATGGRLLVLENGHYGERLAEIAMAHAIDVTRLTVPWGEVLDPTVVTAALGRGAYTHVAAVHHETSTGMLNDMETLGRIAHRHGAQFLVDAVSSVGCEHIDLSADPIDWLAGSSNKCLEGIPGLSFVTARHSAWEDLAARPAPGYYLNLARHAQAQIDLGTPVFTPAVHTLYALAKAVELTLAEGVSSRRARYAGLTARLRAGLEELGLRIALEPQQRASMLTCVELPPGHSFEELHHALGADGFVIYASQGPLRERQLRLATMGQMTENDVDRCLESFSAVIARKPQGAGTRAER